MSSDGHELPCSLVLGGGGDWWGLEQTGGPHPTSTGGSLMPVGMWVRVATVPVQEKPESELLDKSSNLKKYWLKNNIGLNRASLRLNLAHLSGFGTFPHPFWHF